MITCTRQITNGLTNQETGNHNPSDKDYDEWRQGLSSVREQGCTDSNPGCEYNDNCEDKDSITKKWACGKDISGQWKKYYGRGAKQLSYNLTMDSFHRLCLVMGSFLDNPDFVADTWLNMASGTWFYATPQPPKLSMLHVIARNRIEYYKQFAWYLYVDNEREELGCAGQQQFSARGAGALTIYWDKDWANPYSCTLFNYQTAHSALVSG
jgi:hypothetical protein